MNTNNYNATSPASFPRRILLAVTGLSPQIVTETLYALAVVRQPAFVPTEIHLITTATGQREAELNLLAPRLKNGQPGWFHRLRSDYHLPPITFDHTHIHVIDDEQGRPQDDIRTPAENERAADYITHIVRQLSSDRSAALHVSIAGGRKTMGYYVGYALSLYGRPQDRLSHVLVSAPYEGNRDFYYPTPTLHDVDVDNGTYDARKAQVDLAEIPFVRLRDELPERLRSANAGFSDVGARANRGLEPPRLILSVPQFRAWADDEPIEVSETEFLLLLWLAERAAGGEALTDWSSDEAAAEFLELVARTKNSASGAYERIEETLLALRNNPIKTQKYFEPHKSRLNKAFDNALGKPAAQRYAVARQPRKNDTPLFSLPLDPDQIEIQR